jgi:DNA-directed RNA polymerase specialized sigma24 family protein
LMLEGMEYDEMAQVLGISESNVGARLSRARQMLRESMEVHQLSPLWSWKPGASSGRRMR